MKFPGGGMNNMMAQAMKMQNEMKSMQAKLAKKEFEFESAGGRIKTKVNGVPELIDIKISPELIDPEDPSMLEDLIKVAVNEAITTSQAEISKEMSKAVPPGLGSMFGM